MKILLGIVVVTVARIVWRILDNQTKVRECDQKHKALCYRRKREKEC